MSVEHYDLGQRLRAALNRRPVPRSTHALALPPLSPVAVAVHRGPAGSVLTATDHAHTASAGGPAALTALAAVHGPATDTHRGLVVTDRATLRALTGLGRAAAVGGPHEQLTETIDWWQTRAEHPGSGAVLVLTEACRARWTLGTAPTEEQQFQTWRTWLGLAATETRAPATSGMLAAAALVTDGAPLPGLDAAAADDERSWMALRSRTVTPTVARTWRSRDTRARAALGLASRSDAADLMASRGLDDPRIAAREGHTGNVVRAVLTAVVEPGVIEVHADRLACRLRPGADLTVTADPQPSLPGVAPDAAADARTTVRVSVALTHSSITGDGRLALVMTGAARTLARLRPGDALTIRAATLNPSAQSNSRRTLQARCPPQQLVGRRRSARTHPAQRPPRRRRRSGRQLTTVLRRLTFRSRDG